MNSDFGDIEKPLTRNNDCPIARQSIVLKSFLIIGSAAFLYLYAIPFLFGKNFHYMLVFDMRFQPANQWHFIFRYISICTAIFMTISFLWQRNYLNKLKKTGFIAFLFIVILIFNVSLASTRGGFWRAIPNSFSETSAERPVPAGYCRDIVKINDIKSFLHDYVSLMPQLSIHGCTHPPGPDIFMYAILKYLNWSALSASLIAIIISALSVIPLYLIFKLVLSEAASRFGVLIWAFTPSIVIYSATCMDGVFMFFSIWTFYFFLYYLVREKHFFLSSVLTGIFLAITLFMTFSGIYLVLFFFFISLFYLRRNIQKAGMLFLNLLIVSMTFMTIYFFMYYLTGFNIRECLTTAVVNNMRFMKVPFVGWKYFESLVVTRISNFAAYFTFMGFASTGIFFVYLSKKFRRSHPENKYMGYTVFISVLTLLVITLGGVYWYETQRIWIFLSPLFLIPVSETILSISADSLSSILPLELLAFNFIQTILLELLFNTYS